MNQKLKYKMKNFLARISNLRSMVSRNLKYTLASIIYFNGISEKLLVRSLLFIYGQKFNRDWKYSKRLPHFTDFRVLAGYFALSQDIIGPYSFYRGFFSSEIIRPGDCVLDIGCGDGFFDKKFLAEKSSHVDALDIDDNAIRTAKRFYSANNITYHLRDAVTQSFPKNRYDVVVWDGAIGHFSSTDIDIVLNKIFHSMDSDSIFTGSESLGNEGHDHYQYFKEIEDFGKLFKPYFKYIKLKTVQYKLRHSDFIRTEAFWQCSNSKQRLTSSEWTYIAN
jgi:SAM-dependent methyltransferase